MLDIRENEHQELFYLGVDLTQTGGDTHSQPAGRRSGITCSYACPPRWLTAWTGFPCAST